jgi:hypothetical protein
VDSMVPTRIGRCNRQVPGAYDSVTSHASPMAVAEFISTAANSATGLCVPISDGLTISG